MNLKLIAIGKTDNKTLQSLIDDYEAFVFLYQVRFRYHSRY
jgi:hypothetical protein